MAEHYESNKFYGAFDNFDSNAHIVVVEPYELKKFYDALLVLIYWILMLT